MYNAGAPIKTHVPFSLESGSMVENAIENGIIEIPARLGLMLVMNIAIIVSVIGPINEMRASSLSVGFSNFFPILPVFELVYPGQRTAEKNSLPKLRIVIKAGRMSHAGNPLLEKCVDLVKPYLFMCQSENFVEIPFPSE